MIQLNETFPILGFHVHCCQTGTGGLNDVLTFGPADTSFSGWADSLQPLAWADNAETLALNLKLEGTQCNVGVGAERPDSSASSCFRFWAWDFWGSKSSKSSSLSKSLNYGRQRIRVSTLTLYYCSINLNIPHFYQQTQNEDQCLGSQGFKMSQVSYQRKVVEVFGRFV